MSLDRTTPRRSLRSAPDLRTAAFLDNATAPRRSSRSRSAVTPAGPGRDPLPRDAEVRHRRLMVAVDLLCLSAATAGSMWVAAATGHPIDPAIDRLVIALMVLWPIGLWTRRSRSASVLAVGPEEYRRVLAASLWTLALTAAGAYLFGLANEAWFLLSTGVAGTAALFAGRNLLRRGLHRRLRAGRPLHRLYVVASGSQHHLIREQLDKGAGVFTEVGSWCLSGGPDPQPAAVVAAARAHGADTIVYAPGEHSDPTWPRQLGWAMEDTELSLLVSPALTDIAGPRLSIEPVESLPLVRIDMPRFSGPARVIKRAGDLFGAAVGLLVLALPMAVVAVAIKLDSPGPVFFRQIRVGAGGTRFRCWKFRTMSEGADRRRDELRSAAGADGATFKLEADPRITRVGAVLRRLSIDELPQLWNVLRGEMSLVGPRPHPLDDVERYDDVATRRLLAKPGMTGLWQVSGRSDLSWQQAVMLDLYYVENWSITMDLVIALRTFKVVLSGTGAY